MNFHECSWVFTVFHQGFDHGHMLYTAGPTKLPVCCTAAGSSRAHLPNMLLWQTNDTSVQAPKPNLRTDSHLITCWCQSFLHGPPVLRAHAATRSVFTSLSSKQQQSTPPTPARCGFQGGVEEHINSINSQCSMIGDDWSSTFFEANGCQSKNPWSNFTRIFSVSCILVEIFLP